MRVVPASCMRAARRVYSSIRGSTALLILLAISIGTSAAAQEKVIALRSQWLVDGTGQPPVSDAIVVVRGDTIEAAGPAASIRIPPGAEVIELPEQTILPGLIDTHSHLANRSMYPSRFSGRGPAPEDMLKVVRHARVLLLCGITTVREAGERHYNDLLFKEAVSAGMHVGPRIISSGETITITGVGSSGARAPSDGPEEIRKKVRENFEAGAEWIKLVHIDMSPNSASLSPAELEAAVDEAHRLGLKVTVHATGRWGVAIRTAVEAGVDNIEHARPLSEELIQLMLEHGTTASLTPLAYVGWFPRPADYEVLDLGVKNASEWMDYLDSRVDEYLKANPEAETQDRPFISPISGDTEGWRVKRDFYPALERVRKQYRRAYELGLPFSLGLDNRLCGMAWQLEFLVDAGIPPMDAIRAATSVAAKLSDYENRIGTVQKGRLADLISVEGHPLEDIRAMRRVRFIMKDGVRYDNLSWR